ncbi:DsbA family protein [Nanoarchaeota archaeon]
MEEKKEYNISLTMKRTTLWKAGTILFAALFLITLLGWWPGVDSGNTVVPTEPSNPTAPTGSVKVEIESNDPVLGAADAEITMVEFSDFQCTFCERVSSDALAQFKTSDYFKDGQVNLIYKHFPLNSIHPFAQNAAEASECANRQGKFWEYHDTLFANQEALDDTSLKQYASQLGLDTAEFNDCLDNDEAQAEVVKETAQAQASGGRGTPYFVIINNDNEATQAVSGARPWADFEAAIASLL